MLGEIVKGDRILTMIEVTDKVGFGRHTIYRKVAAGTFPAPAKIGGKSIRWRESDVDRWIAEQFTQEEG